MVRSCRTTTRTVISIHADIPRCISHPCTYTLYITPIESSAHCFSGRFLSAEVLLSLMPRRVHRISSDNKCGPRPANRCYPHSEKRLTTSVRGKRDQNNDRCWGGHSPDLDEPDFSDAGRESIFMTVEQTTSNIISLNPARCMCWQRAFLAWWNNFLSIGKNFFWYWTRQ